MFFWKILHRKLYLGLLFMALTFLVSSYVNEWTDFSTPKATDILEPLPINLSQLRAAVFLRNNDTVAANRRRYHSLQDATAVVIVVRVGAGGAGVLARLIASLAHVRGLQQALLVLSHATYNETVYWRDGATSPGDVIELYYPHSIQLNPSRFPGPSARDCGAPGADPDDCAPRDARTAQGKHHWWWTANLVFNQIPAAMAGAPVIFLEDEHEVAPDMLHMARLAQRAFAHYPTARVASLGRCPAGAPRDPRLLVLDVWRPAYADGLMLNATVWQRIASLATRYCMFDDSSWRQSLLNVFAGFPGGRVDVVAVAEARVTRGGRRRRPRMRLFPRRARSRHVWARGTRQARWAPGPAPAAGGWADLRDQLFCLDPQIDID